MQDDECDTQSPKNIAEYNADEKWMDVAIKLGSSQIPFTPPNPWVGCVLITKSGEAFYGATQPPGGKHAEIVAIEAAGDKARGSTMYVTLEPCSHYGRTPPCTQSIIKAGVNRVFIALADPDKKVNGDGIRQLQSASIECRLGLCAEQAAKSLLPYLKHRNTGKPFVVLKLAATMDGYIAAPDYSSKWITGEEARKDAHRLRSESGAVLVGANTVRHDDPELTVRLVEGNNPLRIVLGKVDKKSNTQPLLEWTSGVEELLDYLGEKGILQLLVEGGSKVAGTFHDKGLVDKYIIYFTPGFLGNGSGVHMISGVGAQHLSQIWRGKFGNVQKIGEDLRVEIVPTTFDTILTKLSQL